LAKSNGNSKSKTFFTAKGAKYAKEIGAIFPFIRVYLRLFAAKKVLVLLFKSPDLPLTGSPDLFAAAVKMIS